jgi:GDP-L-fucose synthase
VIRADSPDENVRKALEHLGGAASPSPAVVLWGTGERYREFLHVDDLATACVHLVKNYDCREIGEFVNIGTGEDKKVKDLAVLVKEIVGFSGRIEVDRTKPGGMPKKLLDISRTKASTGSLRSGLKRVYERPINYTPASKGTSVKGSSDSLATVVQKLMAALSDAPKRQRLMMLL